MDDSYVARRKALTVAVAAICLETGYGNATQDALATFTEMIQSCKLLFILIISCTYCNCLLLDITEIGRLSQAYAEVAFRTQPTLADVHMSLVTIGGPQTSALMEYAKRPNKRHLTRRKNTRNITCICNYVLIQNYVITHLSLLKECQLVLSYLVPQICLITYPVCRMLTLSLQHQ